MGLGDSMRRTKLRNVALGGAHAVTTAVVYESLNSFLESAPNCLKFVCDRILVHATGKSDVVKGLGCFDYAVAFHLPKEKAAACFESLFHCLSVLWVGCQRATNNLFWGMFEFCRRRNICISGWWQPLGLKLETWTLSYLGVPSCVRSQELWQCFNLFFCVCWICWILLDLPVVIFGSPNTVGDGPGSFVIFMPQKSFLLGCNPERNLFTDASSIFDCLETLKISAGTAVEPS